MTSILFVPWPLTEKGSGKAGSDYVDKNNSWIKTQQEKKKRFLSEGNDEIREIYQVWYSGHPSGMMGSLKETDQVYIRGHSLVGIQCIFSPDNTMHFSKTADSTVKDALNPSDSDRQRKQGADCLYAKDVLTRLKESGLKESFAGKLKCYNCHSYEGEPNFAQALADAMYEAGYKSCKIYGYKGALSSMPEGTGDLKGHKTSTEGGRASHNRFLVTPKQVKAKT
jgi:hypothetical protein